MGHQHDAPGDKSELLVAESNKGLDLSCLQVAKVVDVALRAMSSQYVQVGHVQAGWLSNLCRSDPNISHLIACSSIVQ
jgi:hypothetical protein